MVYINREKISGMPLNEDDKLMIQVASGNINAFESLVRRYQDKAIKFCYGQLNNYQLAEDVSQEAFFRLYKSAKHYQPQDSFNGFFHKIMLNLCRNASKKRGKSPATFNRPGSDILINSPENSSPLQALETKEVRLMIRSAIDKLPKKHHEVITLKELEGLKYREIAELLQISIDKVKIRLYRARRQLSELLKPQVNNQ